MIWGDSCIYSLSPVLDHSIDLILKNSIKLEDKNLDLFWGLSVSGKLRVPGKSLDVGNPNPGKEWDSETSIQRLGETSLYLVKGHLKTMDPLSEVIRELSKQEWRLPKDCRQVIIMGQELIGISVNLICELPSRPNMTFGTTVYGDIVQNW